MDNVGGNPPAACLALPSVHVGFPTRTRACPTHDRRDALPRAAFRPTSPRPRSRGTREAFHVKLNKRNSALVATALAGAMLLSACGGGDSDDSGSGAEGGGGGGTFSLFITEPQNALIPGTTTESEGDQVINSLFTGLVKFTEEGEVDYSGVAESIESEDNQNWTITLKDGWTFHDGTPVNAESFVKAWNYTANPQNAQDGSGYLSRIAGYQAAPGRRRDRALRPRGRGRPDLHGRARDALRPVPGGRGLQPLLPAPRGVLRGPGGLRQAADRQRPVPGRGGVGARPGRHPDQVRGLRR